MKIYGKNSALCTLHSLMGTLDKTNNNTKEVMETFISMANDKDINYFVKIFNEIIKKTSEQFLPIDNVIKKYYSEFFANKMKKLYDKKITKITDNDFKSYCNNLFNAYVRCNILKIRQKENTDVLLDYPEITKDEKQDKTDFVPLFSDNVNNNTTQKETPKKKIRKNNVLLNEW